MAWPAPTADDLRALADKYRALAALRRARDQGEAMPARAALRELAQRHPGCLRELDTLGLTELDRRAQAATAAAEGGAREPWMAWICAYHRLMKGALAARRATGGESLAGIPAAILSRPPGGRLSPVILRAIAQEFQVAATLVAETLFPVRRPPPYMLDEPMSPLISRLMSQGHPSDVAVISEGPPVPYARLRERALRLAAQILDGRSSLEGAPVAFLAPPSVEYVEALLAVFAAGGTAVPLSPLHTAPELDHLLADARPVRVLATAALAPRLGGRPTLVLDGTARPPAATPALVAPGAPALMLYTSGTTGRPKGVVLSHAALAACCASLETAWGWRRDDRLLHVLPLHHTHGVVVALMGALWAGARVQLARFDAGRLWPQFADSSVFMAVPTMYAKLIEAFQAAAPDEQAAFAQAAARVRLFTSGSAALPAAHFQAFQRLTGQTILERYGMTEIGMALSNSLDGPRIGGAVGVPLPGVSVDVVDESGADVPPGQPGELRVRTPQIMSGYHGDPEATRAAFDEQGRFKTGDTGVRDEAGVFRILGRTSTDILKSGGYKLSALEIEAVVREHPAIAEVAVVGVPDEDWGERVTACVVLAAGATLTLDELAAWARARLAAYKIPRALVFLPDLPRTPMGKVQKRLLRDQLGRSR